MSRVITGLDHIREGAGERFKGHRLGLLANQASVDSHLRKARDVLADRLPGHLRVLFGPQHGFGGEDQDNMIETPHARDLSLQIPLYSLYADSREPSPAMLEGIDTLLIDLQDVGTRVYTFASTMLHCLRAAAASGKKVVILDRPNPLGGRTTEGNLLQPSFYSFVGPYQLPMRHGLTMGELALLFNHVYALGADLEIVQMKGWKRSMLWPETGLTWVMPSPNMPLWETALVYPGQVIWEGTALSEGRGTCRPFEIFGAPYLNPARVFARLEARATRGCCLQEFTFRPTFNKWAGERCNGFFLHVLTPQTYEPFYTSLSLLQAIIEVHGDRFQWKPPPYEYEYEKKPIDLILGDGSIRPRLERGEGIARITGEWEAENRAYLDWREPFLLYP